MEILRNPQPGEQAKRQFPGGFGGNFGGYSGQGPLLTASMTLGRLEVGQGIAQGPRPPPPAATLSDNLDAKTAHPPSKIEFEPSRSAPAR
jgi:hypothetical protein